MARPQIKKFLHLFLEGEVTEPRYIKDLCGGVVHCHTIRFNPDPKNLAKEAELRAKNIPINVNETPIEFWVVFDNDKPDKVKEAYSIIENYNNRKNSENPKINIAFNNPCIEIWALLHFTDKTPTTASECQTKLENFMPGYNHRNHKVFDVKKMEDKNNRGYDKALKDVKSWKRTIETSGSKEYDTTRFAGIAFLAESIKQ